MKIADLVKLEKERKNALKKIKEIRPDIISKIKRVLPDVKIIQVKPVGSVTDKKLFREDSKVDIGVYIKSSDYKSGMNKELTDKFKNLYDDINVIVFVIEDKNVLTELKKVGYTSNYEGKRVIIAPDGYVFIFDDDNIEEIDEILLDRYNNDVEGIHEETEDGYHSFIMGVIQRNMLGIAEMTESDLTSVLSTSIKKVVKELNLEGITYESSYSGYDVEHDISRDDILDATFKNADMFHGTNSRYIMNILSKGIMPPKHTNFDKIFHKDKIFFTSKYQYSLFHAFNSARRNKTVPIVIKFKIPDESKVVLDYDIAIKLYGYNHPLTKKLGYEMLYKDASGGKTTYSKKDVSNIEKWKKLADKASLNTRAGVFGYTGRIPASYILGLYIDPDSIQRIAEYEYYGETYYDQDEEPDANDMVFMSVTKFKKLLQSAINDLVENDEEDEDY